MSRPLEVEHVQAQLWSVFSGDGGLEDLASGVTGRHHAWRAELLDLVEVAAPANCIRRIRLHFVAGYNTVVASAEAKVGASLPRSGFVNGPVDRWRLPHCRAVLVVEFKNTRRLWGLKQLRHKWSLHTELVHKNTRRAHLVSTTPPIVEVHGRYYPIDDLKNVGEDEPLRVLLFKQADGSVYASTSIHSTVRGSRQRR